MRALTIFRFLLLLFVCLTPFNGAASGGPVNFALSHENFIGFTFLAVVLTIVCTDILKPLLGFTKSTKPIAKVALSWATGLNVAIILFYARVGFLAEVDLVFAVKYGVVIAALANGVYSTKIIKILASVFVKLFKQEKSVH